MVLDCLLPWEMVISSAMWFMQAFHTSQGQCLFTVAQDPGLAFKMLFIFCLYLLCFSSVCFLLLLWWWHPHTVSACILASLAAYHPKLNPWKNELHNPWSSVLTSNSCHPPRDHTEHTSDHTWNLEVVLCSHCQSPFNRLQSLLSREAAQDPCHFEIALLQLAPGRSSPAHHQTPVTDPEHSCACPTLFHHTITPSTGVFNLPE